MNSEKSYFDLANNFEVDLPLIKQYLWKYNLSDQELTEIWNNFFSLWNYLIDNYIKDKAQK